MTLFNTFTIHAGRWCSGMTLACHGEGPGSTRTQYFVASVIFFYCLQCFELFSLFFLFLEKVQGKGAFFFSSVLQLYIRDFIFKIWIGNKLNKKYYCEKRYFSPYEAMVKFPSSVISEIWKISKSLLVTISKFTMKLHNVQI